MHNRISRDKIIDLF